MKDHPDSPVKASELRTDATRRSYVIRGGAAYRVRTRVIETAPRRFVRWTDLSGCIGKASHVLH